MKSQEHNSEQKLTVKENIKIALMKFVLILTIAFVAFLITSRFNIVIL